MTIALNCCKSFNMGTNKIDNSKIENQVGQQQCFNSSNQLKGFSSTYFEVSFNGNYKAPSGIQQSSYIEYGFLNINFVSGQMYVYSLNDNGTAIFKSSLWVFGSNHTQYVSGNIDGTDYCFQQPLSYSPPSIEGLNYVTDSKLGSPSNLSDSSNVILFVDKSDCSFISISSENTNNTPSGSSLTNFYNYNSSADSSYFQLPSVCFNEPNSEQLKLKSSVQLPKVLGNLPF
ncbi:hypothetical protein ACTFIZ_002760 [Dictyostelium cf. discoideum]